MVTLALFCSLFLEKNRDTKTVLQRDDRKQVMRRSYLLTSIQEERVQAQIAKQ